MSQYRCHWVIHCVDQDKDNVPFTRSFRQTLMLGIPPTRGIPILRRNNIATQNRPDIWLLLDRHLQGGEHPNLYYDCLDESFNIEEHWYAARVEDVLLGTGWEEFFRTNPT